jgi:hypothetical protein
MAERTLDVIGLGCAGVDFYGRALRPVDRDVADEQGQGGIAGAGDKA